MRLLSIFLAVVMLAGAAFAQENDLAQRRKQLNEILNDYWEYTMRTAPEYASILGDKRYNDKLSDNSYAAVLRDLEETRKYLARLDAVDSNGFPEQEKLNKELLVRQLRMGLEGARFKPWEMPVNQFNGIHIDMPQLVSMLAFTSVKDYEDYIARLNAMPLAFEQTEELMRMGMQSGRIPPKILLDQVVKQAKGIAETKPEASPFAQPVSKFPDSISAADQKRLHDAVIEAITTKITPAYEKFTRFVAGEYAPKGRTEPGVWALPDGETYYAYLVKQSTTTDKTPEEIHQLGLQQVADDRAAMLAIAKKMGFNDLKSFEASIKSNPQLHPKSRQQILDTYQKYEDQMWTKLPQLFTRLPEAKVTVMPVEEFREKEASAAQYNQGTPDGSRPGHIMVNTGDFATRLTIDMESTAYHEGVPGHHLQISIAQEIPTLPKFRQHAYYTAFTEGWALYSERLGKEVGFYQDPYNDYGRLQDDLLRAIRLVVDTGFHYKHWSRQQVVDYFHNNSAIDETNVQEETDRYIAWPAQALGYKMGQLKILELRERAKAQLGSAFDIRKYDDEVVDSGALPLDVLDARINSWIAEQKKVAAQGSTASALR